MHSAKFPYDQFQECLILELYYIIMENLNISYYPVKERETTNELDDSFLNAGDEKTMDRSRVWLRQPKMATADIPINVMTKSAVRAMISC